MQISVKYAVKYSVYIPSHLHHCLCPQLYKVYGMLWPAVLHQAGPQEPSSKELRSCQGPFRPSKANEPAS